jgi:uncharacterized protein YkwD
MSSYKRTSYHKSTKVHDRSNKEDDFDDEEDDVEVKGKQYRRIKMEEEDTENEDNIDFENLELPKLKRTDTETVYPGKNDKPIKTVADVPLESKPKTFLRKEEPKVTSLTPVVNVRNINDIRRAVLDEHNKERRRLGLVDLTLDEGLNQQSQSWAEHMASKSVFKHSKTPGMGESIAMRSPYEANPIDLYNQWYREKDNFTNDVWGKCQVDKSGCEVGHYSQIVWSKTTKLGVGYACNQKNKSTYLVCNYTPSGNWIGEKVY